MTGDCVRHPGAPIAVYLTSTDEDPDVAAWCSVCDREAAEEEAGAFLADHEDHPSYFPVFSEGAGDGGHGPSEMTAVGPSCQGTQSERGRPRTSGSQVVGASVEPSAADAPSSPGSEAAA